MFTENNMPPPEDLAHSLQEVAEKSGRTDGEGSSLIHIDTLLATIHAEWQVYCIHTTAAATATPLAICTVP